MTTIQFAEALERSAGASKRNLILGNGFSIACCPDIFHYGSLFDEADFTGHDEAQRAFEVLGTQDFEQVIRALNEAASLQPIYQPDQGDAAALMRTQAAALKDILLATIASRHPDTPLDIPDERFWACRAFLANFLVGPRRGHVYSLNYDLLLYWALMHDDNPFLRQHDLRNSDGFGNDEDDPDADYVVWQGEKAANTADIHYLHGALHLFDAGSELKKYTWNRTGEPLIEQARAALERGYFPLFVAEGDSHQKKNKIRHNAYLYQGLKVLDSNARQPRQCFFVFGHSLAANDDHILRSLARGRCHALYVGLYGDPTSDANREIRMRASALADRRPDASPLEVTFFDAASANVWGA